MLRDVGDAESVAAYRLGPMVSAGVPVYDRMYSPPIFRGVVTIDMRSCDMCPLHTTQPVPISIAGGCGIHSVYLLSLCILSDLLLAAHAP